MPRVPRSRQGSAAGCYHVFNRGHNRETLFHDDDDRTRFLALVSRYRDRFAFRLSHYCLMGNHFHLLVQFGDPRQLSRCLAGMLLAYVRYANRRHGFVGHLFQGRFKSPAIEAEVYLLSCGRYIERNPLEAGLVAESWAYPWSSCRAYALGQADPLLARNPWYEELSPDPEQRCRLWREFLVGSDPKEEAVRQGDWVIGGARFRQRMQRLAARPAPRGRGRPRHAAEPE
jgi:putative transposase